MSKSEKPAPVKLPCGIYVDVDTAETREALVEWVYEYEKERSATEKLRAEHSYLKNTQTLTSEALRNAHTRIRAKDNLIKSLSAHIADLDTGDGD